MIDPIGWIRDLVQRDPGERGLAAIPGDNLLTLWPNNLTFAARSIAWHPRPHLVLLTGFPIVRGDRVNGETDGPLGALFLARAFRPLGIDVTIAAEPFWPTQRTGSPAERMILSDPLPELPAEVTHLVSIERVGPSWQDGRCYTMRAGDVTPWLAPAHRWFEERRPAGVVTIGIGDGGNEIGMGKIPRDVIARNIDRGATIACRVPVDHLIVAGVSNWGAYALAAAVHHLRGTTPAPDLFDPRREEAVLRQLVEQDGLVDGKTGRAEPTVDGLSGEEYFGVLTALGRKLEECRVEV